MTIDAPANPYLVGNFAPVPDELTAEDLPVEGSIPPSLDGWLLRNGPNPIAPDPATHHWFTGDGMLHGIHLSGGRARSYRNRWVRTEAASRALGEAPLPALATDTHIGQFNVANTHVVTHAGRILALVETCLPTEVRTDLSTVGLQSFGGSLRTPMTAHPKTDPETGELLFFGYDVFGPPYLRYHVVDASGALVRSEDITLPAATMVHDFAVTATRVVFLDLPVVFDLGMFTGAGVMPFRWEPSNGARLGVMPRGGGDADVRWTEIAPCYVFHVMNAFDDGEDVVLDVCRYEHMFAGDRHGIAGADPLLERWRLSPDAGLDRQQVSERPAEFPRVDDRVAGRPHRFGFLNSVSARDGVRPAGLRKVDLSTGVEVEHQVGEGRAAGEGVFVPDSPGAGEDEGWVLSVVYDAARDGSDLIVLDTSDFAAPPVATVRLPRRVPFGFHGSWVPVEAVAGT